MFCCDSFLDISGGRYTRSQVISVCLSFTPINVLELGVLIRKAPWCLFIKEAINGLEMSLFYLNSISDGAKACYHGPLALMKGDEAGRRLPVEKSRVGLDASEAFPP